jgi:hypothetical protein
VASRVSIETPVHIERLWGATVTYLVVGIDYASLAPWHQNISASDVARAARSAAERAAAAGIDLVVAAVVGPHSTVLPHPVGEPVARARAA